MRNIPAGPQHRNHPPGVMVIYSPGDPHKEPEKMTHLLSLPLWKDPGVAVVSWLPSMDSWLGPTRRGTVSKQLSPAGSGLGGGGL